MKKLIKLKVKKNADIDVMQYDFIRALSDKYEFVISDSPEYVISFDAIPDFLEYDCIRIQDTGENIRPDFNVCDYAIGFDHIQFDDRYIRWPLYAEDARFSQALTKHIIDTETDYYSRKFCNFVVSNGGDVDPFRESFYDILDDYSHVDSGGRYRNNVGRPVDDKYEFQKKYKFSLAFENSSTKGYITEKIVQAWAAKTIPIYYGAPDVSKDFNKDSFIDYHDYDNVDSFMKEIKRVNEDKEAYINMLKTPIYNENSNVLHYMNRKPLYEFYDHIFSQNYHDAIRRTNCEHGYGKIYEFRLREYNDLKKSKLVRISNYLDHTILHKRDIWKDQW